MGAELIIMLVLGVLGAIVGMASTAETNAANEKSVQESNETNLQIARETNASNVEQANLAYQRSLPMNQVKNLMDAGMSRAGALNMLTGGGTYAAPTLQSASTQPATYDYSGFASAFERLNGIPSNAEQFALIEAQRDALRAETKAKEDANRRAEEMHQFDLWQRQYGKDNATALDSASSIIANALLDSGKDIKDFKSFEDMINGLDLQKNAQIREMPYSARSQVEESVRNKFNDALARRAADNVNIAAKDAHVAAKDVHQSAKDSHEKHVEDIKRARFEYEQAVKEGNVQDKERTLRDLRAQADIMLAEDGLKLSDYRHSLEFDANGNIRFSRKVSEKSKRAWDRLADTIGIGILQDLVRGIVTIAK